MVLNVADILVNSGFLMVIESIVLNPTGLGTQLGANCTNIANCEGRDCNWLIQSMQSLTLRALLHPRL